MHTNASCEGQLRNCSSENYFAELQKIAVSSVVITALNTPKITCIRCLQYNAHRSDRGDGTRAKISELLYICSKVVYLEYYRGVQRLKQ